MKDLLDKIKADAEKDLEIASKATEGPWELEEEDDRMVDYGWIKFIGDTKLQFYGRTNARFIARYRTAVPRLANQVKTLIFTIEEILNCSDREYARQHAARILAKLGEGKE